ncbi:MAG: hypothetical protein AAGK21_04010 [Bacteroidota bacterium]
MEVTVITVRQLFDSPDMAEAFVFRMHLKGDQLEAGVARAGTEAFGCGEEPFASGHDVRQEAHVLVTHTALMD